MRSASSSASQQREWELDRQRYDDDRQVVDERSAERAVLEQQRVVLQADKCLRRAVAVPVVEAVPGRFAHGQGDEDGEQEQRRREEEQDDRELAVHRPGTRPLVRKLPGLLHGPRGLLRRHHLGRDVGRDVVDHRADRRPEHLVVEDLVVLRALEVLGDAAQDRVLRGRPGCLSRPGYRSRAQPPRVAAPGARRILRKSTASFGEPLVTSQPLSPPSVSEAAPLPPGVVGKGNQPSWSSGMPFLFAEFARMLLSMKLPCRSIAPLPSPNWPDDCGKVTPRNPG